jgi:hypothetical protein
LLIKTILLRPNGFSGLMSLLLYDAPENPLREAPFPLPGDAPESSSLVRGESPFQQTDTTGFPTPPNTANPSVIRMGGHA